MKVYGLSKDGNWCSANVTFRIRAPSADVFSDGTAEFYMKRFGERINEDQFCPAGPVRRRTWLHGHRHRTGFHRQGERRNRLGNELTAGGNGHNQGDTHKLDTLEENTGRRSRLRAADKLRHHGDERGRQGQARRGQSGAIAGALIANEAGASDWQVVLARALRRAMRATGSASTLAGTTKPPCSSARRLHCRPPGGRRDGRVVEYRKWRQGNDHDHRHPGRKEGDRHPAR